MTDIEIARSTKLYNITKIAKKLNINKKYIELYGKLKYHLILIKKIIKRMVN